MTHRLTIAAVGIATVALGIVIMGAAAVMETARRAREWTR